MSATLTAPPRHSIPAAGIYTGEDLLRHPEWGRCDLIRGKVVPLCRPKSKHGRLLTRLASKLNVFVEERALGIVFSDSGIYLERNPDTVRGPDIHFVRIENCPSEKEMEGYLEIAPDLCVEIVSPSETWSDLETKIGQYHSIGVKLVWAIDPESRSARVYRSNGISEIVPSSGSLVGEDVLPGFAFPLAELFKALELPVNPSKL